MIKVNSVIKHEDRKKAALVSYSNVDDPLDGYKFKSALPFKIFSTLPSESEWTLFNSVRLLGYAVCFFDQNSNPDCHLQNFDWKSWKPSNRGLYK